MRFMVMVKATKDSEAGVLPDQKLLADMGKYNEELVKAGVMLAGEGLQPSSKGARVRFSGSKRTVIDGPFAETKELVAGFWLFQMKSLEEAIEWVKRCPNPMPTRVRDRDPPDLRVRGFRRRVHAGAETTGRASAQAGGFQAIGDNGHGIEHSHGTQLEQKDMGGAHRQRPARALPALRRDHSRHENPRRRRRLREGGIPISTALPLGIIEIVCVILYAIPRTSMLGAILLTGYLGGAVATNVRQQLPMLGYVLFPVYVAVFIWGGALAARRPGAVIDSSDQRLASIHSSQGAVKKSRRDCRFRGTSFDALIGVDGESAAAHLKNPTGDDNAVHVDLQDR